MKSDDVFPSKYIKAVDLDGEAIVLTIRKVYQDDLKTRDGKDEVKPIVEFEERGFKPLVLNVTNWRACERICNSVESDDWPGHRIELFTTEVEAFGELTEAIRIRAPKSKSRARPRPVTEDRPAEEGEYDNLDDDRVPF